MTLDEKAVRRIKRMLIAGYSQQHIASTFGVSRSTIAMIAIDQTWRDVGAPGWTRYIATKQIRRQKPGPPNHPLP